MKSNLAELYIGELLERAAALWPKKEALYSSQNLTPVVTTYADLYARAVFISHYLEKIHIKKHDKVLLWYENSIEFYAAFFGILQIGAVVIPVNTFISTVEIEHIITDSSAVALIVSPLLEKKVPKNATLIVINQDSLGTQEPIIPAPDEFKIEKLSLYETAVLMYTSGTTGRAKGVMLSSHALMTNAIQGITALKTDFNDRIYVALPLFHSLMQNSGIICPFLVGACCILISKIDRRNLLQALTYKPTCIIGVPSLFGLFCLLKTADFSCVRFFLCGGDLLSEKIRMYFELIYNRKLCNGYGLTETAPFVAVNLEDTLQKTGDVGMPLTGINVEIRNELGTVVEAGTIGELCVQGENLMLGYYNDPEATKKVLINSWFNTGDLAFLDQNNHIILAGRLKDLIICKGIKIYPQEVETVLLSHTDVLYAAVIGKNEGETQIPIAYIATKRKDFSTLETELKDLCLKELALYKIPKKIIIKTELPLTALGKVAKKELYES